MPLIHMGLAHTGGAGDAGGTGLATGAPGVGLLGAGLVGVAGVGLAGAGDGVGAGGGDRGQDVPHTFQLLTGGKGVRRPRGEQDCCESGLAQRVHAGAVPVRSVPSELCPLPIMRRPAAHLLAPR